MLKKIYLVFLQNFKKQSSVLTKYLLFVCTTFVFVRLDTDEYDDIFQL